MLRISTSTSKQALFRMLEEATKQNGDLEIQIDSLPAFMSTQIALNIFSYQLDRYPRSIVWKCQDKETAEMLQSCNFRVSRKANIQPTAIMEEQPANIEVEAEVAKSIEPAIIESKEQLSKETAAPLQTEVKNQLVISLSANQTALIKSRQLNGFKQGVVPPVAQSEVTKEQPIATENGAVSGEFNSWQEWFKPRDRLSASSLTDKHTYTPSSLLDKDTRTQSEQDLDQWLQKVHFTKHAIDALHSEPAESAQVISKKLIRKRSPKNRNLSKAFQLLTGAVLTTCMMVLFLLLFPTRVYTVELERSLVEASSQLDFKASEFSQKSISFSASTIIDATGDNEVETASATGTAILLNTSGNAINLTNGGFYLVYQGQKYKHEYDNNQSAVLTIPARNDLNGPTVEIKIRAVNPGAEANLSENTRFSIVNLREQNVGNALFGLSTSAIQNKELSGDKVVTQSDLDLLKTTNQGKIAQDIGKEIAATQTEGVFTNADWFSPVSEKLEFDSNVGEIKVKAGLVTESVTNIYFLPQEKIEKRLRSNNSKIDEIAEIIIKKQTGSFENSESVLNLDVYYSYREPVNLDKNSISQALNDDQNLATAEQTLKEKYPQIKRIEQKDSGLAMPMINPKIDINIVE